MRWFVLLLIIGFASCKKAEEPPIQYDSVLLDSALKSQYLFHVGDYWVYQDQNLQEDSLSVLLVDSSFTSSGPSCCPLVPYQFITLNISNETDGTTFNYYLTRSMIKYNGGGEVGEFGQPIFMIDKNVGYSSNGLTVGETIDSLQVLGNVFTNVQKMSVDASSQFQEEFDYDTDLYFAPNFGIVKIVTHDTFYGTQIKELIRWSIN